MLPSVFKKLMYNRAAVYIYSEIQKATGINKMLLFCFYKL